MKYISYVLLAVSLMVIMAWGASGAEAVNLILPLPLCALVALKGLPAGLAAAGLFVVLWIFIAGSSFGLVSIATILALGLGYGVSLLRKDSPGKTILAGAAFLAAVLLLNLGDLAQVWAGWRQDWAEGINPTMELYRNNGLLAAMAGQGANPEGLLRESLENIAEHMGRLFPTFVIWDMVIAAIITYFLGWWLVSRWRPVPALVPFSRWQMPWPFTWAVIIGLAAFLWGDWQGSRAFQIVGENLLVFCVPLLLVGGLAVFIYLYRYLAVPTVIKVITVVFLFLYPPLGLMLVILLGLFDPLVDLRRMVPEEGKGGEPG